MRHIYQRRQSDCFPTCIAMVSGISYREAISWVHPFRAKGQSYGTTYEHGVRVLRALGFKVRKRFIKNFTSIKQPAILGLQYDGGDHVAVWDPQQKKVLDPAPFPSQSIADYKKHLWCIFILS